MMICLCLLISNQ